MNDLMRALFSSRISHNHTVNCNIKELHLSIYCSIMHIESINSFVIGKATRECNSSGVWQDPNVLSCESVQFAIIRTQV